MEGKRLSNPTFITFADGIEVWVSGDPDGMGNHYGWAEYGTDRIRIDIQATAPYTVWLDGEEDRRHFESLDEAKHWAIDHSRRLLAEREE